MSEPRVLVAYGSRNGGTAQIAGWIGETLTAEGLSADVRPAGTVRDVRPYAAVVLGSGVYAGRWLREAVRFARRYRGQLADVPVWLFSSGPLDASAAEGRLPSVRSAQRLAGELDACGHITFGGRLAPGARGMVARMILSQGRGGDYRDEGQIRSWAAVIARDVAAQFESL